MRINITGYAGVGKSTMAKLLGDALGLPIYNLDSIVWQPGWGTTPIEECRDKISNLTNQPDWIIDGVSRLVWDAADIIVFLDFSRRLSLARCAKRNWPYLFRSRPDLPERCPEILIIPRLIQIIIQIPQKVKPKILEYARTESNRKIFVHIQNAKQLETLTKEVKKNGVEGFQVSSYDSNLRI